MSEDSAAAEVARAPGESDSTRPLSGWLGQAVFWIGVALSLAHVWYNTFAVLPDLTRNTLHFAGLGLMCTAIFPTMLAKGRAAGGAVLAFDLLLAATLVASVIYILVRERAVSGASFTHPLDFAASGAIIVIGVELTRRTTGWIIPAMIVVALSYLAWWGRYVTGPLHFPGLSTETLLQRAIYGEDGMFGQIASISSTYVFMFILFGAFLIKSGAGEFIVDLSRALAGRVTGGPGFVAVLASGLTGTISGSAVANTVSTGVITIPLMKRARFPAQFAAGVEAAASTGGQLMPPIMGAGAFVMANYTQIPYGQIVAVSFLPALLYFVGIAFYVRIEAKRQGLAPDPDAPRLLAVLKAGGIAFLLPLVVIIVLLVKNYTPTFAAGIAIVSVIAASWLTAKPMGPRAIVEALALGARNMVLTGVLLVAVGLIVTVIANAGLGNTFSLMIADWAGGSLMIAIVLIAIASLILGMGLPVTAAYIVLATLSAPALYNLITQSELISMLAAGTVPDSARAVFMLVAPETAGLLGQPMAEADAAALVAAIPIEMAGLIREQVLPPALLTTALLSAHMIIFWLSQDSNVTPPVCLTAFAAAAIAGTRPMATGFTAWKVAKTLYIVPLLFAYTPFLNGDPAQALYIFGFAILGLYAVVAAIEGHAEAPYPLVVRPVLAIIGALLLWPAGPAVNIAGSALLIGFLVWNVRVDRRLAATGTGA
ncbi:MAG: TRAP transporter fused permease subunit [Inquilinus sp.]|nr:TRAP transporter fused permease subunit [Inquilinus sp.]